MTSGLTSMDSVPPSTLCVEIVLVDSSLELAQIESQSPRTRLDSSDSMAQTATSKPQGKVATNVKAEGKSEEKPSSSKTGKKEGKSEEKPSSSKTGKQESWSPDEYFKDAAWFAKNCLLPNEGEPPYKFSDIIKQTISTVFGEETRNEYRLSTCTGIPVEYLLALSKVCDGYDKPVNGVLSHTFARLVYGELILKRTVNWAQYAAQKLRGQILQAHRDEKPRPDGPPCIRNTSVKYVAPVLETSKKPTEEVKAMLSIEYNMPKAMLAIEYNVPNASNATMDAGKGAPSQSSEPNLGSSTHEDTIAFDDSGSNSMELLSVIGKEIEKMKVRLSKVIEDEKAVEGALNLLKSQELGRTTAEIALTAKIGRLEVEISDLERKLQEEEQLVGEATMNLETEQEVEEGVEFDEIKLNLVKMMEDTVKSHQQAVTNTTNVLLHVKTTLVTTTGELERKKKLHAALPKRIDQLKILSTALRTQWAKLESLLSDQIAEERIVASILSKKCSPLSPMFVLTSTRTVLTQATIMSCPICCNGYHCNNWVAASCGHTYHPVCLFTHLTSEKSSLKCIACEEPLSPNWLRCWGLDTTWRQNEDIDRRQALLNKNEAAYGNDSSRLARRREWVKAIDSYQSKVDQAEALAMSGLLKTPSAMTDETTTNVEDDSSMQPLLEVKPEGGSRTKKRQGHVSFTTRTPSSTPSSIAQHSQNKEFTPSATLPFSPKTTVAFKPYADVKSPPSSEPMLAKWKSNQSRKRKGPFS